MDAVESSTSKVKSDRLLAGAIYDLVVDLRRSSPFFGRSVAVELSAENRRQLWVPPGFAHGVVITSETAEYVYKTTDYSAPEYERSLWWNDSSLNIEWPLTAAPMLSGKDSQGTLLADAETFV